MQKTKVINIYPENTMKIKKHSSMLLVFFSLLCIFEWLGSSPLLFIINNKPLSYLKSNFNDTYLSGNFRTTSINTSIQTNNKEGMVIDLSLIFSYFPRFSFLEVTRKIPIKEESILTFEVIDSFKTTNLSMVKNMNKNNINQFVEEYYKLRNKKINKENRESIENHIKSSMSKHEIVEVRVNPAPKGSVVLGKDHSIIMCDFVYDVTVKFIKDGVVKHVTLQYGTLNNNLFTPTKFDFNEAIF